MWYDQYLKDNPTFYDERCVYWCNEKEAYHRDNGPSFINANGDQWWHRNGLVHREDGPAIIWVSFANEWYINDNNITDKVIDWIKENNYPHWKQWDDNIKLHFKLRFVE